MRRMVTVKCSRCGQVGEVYGPGMRFCRRCGLAAGFKDAPPSAGFDWRTGAVLFGVILFVGILVSIVDSLPD